MPCVQDRPEAWVMLPASCACQSQPGLAAEGGPNVYRLRQTGSKGPPQAADPSPEEGVLP